MKNGEASDLYQSNHAIIINPIFKITVHSPPQCVFFPRLFTTWKLNFVTLDGTNYLIYPSNKCFMPRVIVLLLGSQIQC